MLRPSIDLFLCPKRVALLGVSKRADSITARPALFAAQYDTGSETTIIKPDGPRELHGLPVRRSLADMDDVADVAMVMLPADDVVPALQECNDAGVKGAVVISSGFEDGDGIARRALLADFLAQHPHFRMVGPNCVGVASPATATWLTFSSVVSQGRPRTGTVGLVTQSGAVGNGLLLALQRRGTGVSHWISTGNELDVGALESAATLLRRDDCRAVGLFLEGVTDRDCRDSVAEAIAETGKPVVAMRAAASEQGKRAAMGHTGRLIGADRIARTALEEIGVIFVDSLDELTAVLTVTSVAPRRPASGAAASVAVLTVSGATGVLAADEVDRQPGLKMAAFSERMTTGLRGVLGDIPALSIDNPLDVPVLGDPTVFDRTIGYVASSGAADATVAIVSSLAHDYEALSRSQHASSTPLVLAHLSPAEDFTPEQATRLADRGVAVVRTPREAVRALAVWAGGATAPASDETGADTAPAGAVQRGVTGAVSLLDGTIAPWLTPGRRIGNLDEALDFLEQHGESGVVLKADGDTIAHRADVGAVAVNLRTPTAVSEAFHRIGPVCAEHGDHVIMQAMAPPGLEVMVSVVRDPEVGLAVLLKPGGTLVEAGGASVILTERRRHWKDTVHRSTLGALLAGWRGGEPMDESALFDLISELMSAVEKRPDIQLLECNPVLVHPRGSSPGATIVDVLAYTKEIHG